MSAIPIYFNIETQRRIFTQAEAKFGKDDKRAVTKYVQQAVLAQLEKDEKKQITDEWLKEQGL